MIQLAVAIAAPILRFLDGLRPHDRQPQAPPALLSRDVGWHARTDDRCHRAMGMFMVSDRCLW